MPEKPAQELWVALAGPAVNAAISAVLFVWLSITHEWAPLGQVHVASGPFLERLLIANVWLVLFNLIPAFPMDGGRVLRALLASRTEHVRATQIAAGIGQGQALVFGLIGLFGNPMLLFIAHFVWIGVSQEASATQMKAAMARTPIRAAMLTDFRHLDGGDTLADAVRLILEGSQQDFPVLEGVRVAGMLTRSDLLVALAEHGQDYPVTAAMRRDFRLFRLSGGCRGEIEATAVEIDRVDEVLFVAEPSGRIFHPLDLGIDRLAGGVGDPMTEIGDHVFEGSAS